MKDIFEKLNYDNYHEILHSDKIVILEEDITSDEKKLRKNISKKQKNLLLKICDAKDLKSEKCSYKSFESGFKLGLQIGYEVNRNL